MRGEYRALKRQMQAGNSGNSFSSGADIFVATGKFVNKVEMQAERVIERYHRVVTR